MAYVATDNSDGKAPLDARTDLHLCRIVDTAIALQNSANTMSALEYLHRCGIGSALIARVLMEPHRRRADVSSRN